MRPPQASRAWRPEYTVGAIGAAVALIAVVAVVVVLASSGARPATYPPDSPEAAFQAYVQALDRRDTNTAYALLSARVRATYTLDQFSRDMSGYGARWLGPARLRIDRVRPETGRVYLDVAAERYSGGGLSSSRSVSTYVVALVREGAEWRIDERLFWLGDALPVEAPPPAPAQ